MMIGYMDGHAASYAETALLDFTFHHDEKDEASGDFMMRYVGEFGCGGTRIHSLPPAPTE